MDVNCDYSKHGLGLNLHHMVSFDPRDCVWSEKIGIKLIVFFKIASENPLVNVYSD